MTVTQALPKGFHTVTPFLIVNNVEHFIDFAKRAFDAEERSRLAMPDGSIMQASIKIGDSVIMLGGSTMSAPTTSCIYLYVDDSDAVYKQAISAGATSIQEPTDQIYGDRTAGVKDTAGNQWWVATHWEDVPEDELRERANRLYAGPRD
jgi:uncharacterized glyoxalase superfamily protein PhnB